ncbi:MAG: type II secretion system F family protein [Candidatus Accumulibacter sp.]|jgi:general secretion pathway protein F|nr:type II secretion system F family protein [Accumulibacter sp.]
MAWRTSANVLPLIAPKAVANEHLRITVREPDGKTRILEFANVGQEEAVRRVVARGFRILAIEHGSDSAPQAAKGFGTHFPLNLFSQELLALLSAGLNLTEALSTLYAKEQHANTKDVLAAVLQSLREGHSFSDVLAAHPRHFPEVYIATVRASERTGDLAQALARYIAYQLQFETIRKKLMSAAIYPTILLIVGGLVTLFLLGYVVPRFSVVYESSGRDIPWLSSVLLSFGKLIYANWQLALGGLLGAIGLLAWGISLPYGRALLLDAVLSFPLLAVRADEFRLSRFYHAVSLLLASGVALPRAIGMVSGLLGVSQRDRLAQCQMAIDQGRSLSSALVDARLASPVAESLIKVGERSGQLAEMLERTTLFADEEFSRWMDWASRLIEPMLMTVIGLVIGTVVVLMYLPIFDLAGNLQ